MYNSINHNHMEQLDLFKNSFDLLKPIKKKYTIGINEYKESVWFVLNSSLGMKQKVEFYLKQYPNTTAIQHDYKFIY